MPNTDLNLSDSSIKCHPIPLTVDEVAVIHRLVQTHLVTKPEDDPEYSTSEHCERAPCCSTKSSAGYRVHPTR